MEIDKKSPEKKNKAEKLPLHLAVEYQCGVDVIDQFLFAYPDANTMRDKNGKLPIHYCVDSGISSGQLLHEKIIPITKFWPPDVESSSFVYSGHKKNSVSFIPAKEASSRTLFVDASNPKFMFVFRVEENHVQSSNVAQITSFGLCRDNVLPAKSSTICCGLCSKALQMHPSGSWSGGYCDYVKPNEVDPCGNSIRSTDELFGCKNMFRSGYRNNASCNWGVCRKCWEEYGPKDTSVAVSFGYGKDSWGLDIPVDRGEGVSFRSCDEALSYSRRRPRPLQRGDVVQIYGDLQNGLLNIAVDNDIENLSESGTGKPVEGFDIAFGDGFDYSTLQKIAKNFTLGITFCGKTTIKLLDDTYFRKSLIEDITLGGKRRNDVFSRLLNAKIDYLKSWPSDLSDSFYLESTNKCTLHVNHNDKFAPARKDAVFIEIQELLEPVGNRVTGSKLEKDGSKQSIFEPKFVVTFLVDSSQDPDNCINSIGLCSKDASEQAQLKLHEANSSATFSFGSTNDSLGLGFSPPAFKSRGVLSGAAGRALVKGDIVQICCDLALGRLSIRVDNSIGVDASGYEYEFKESFLQDLSQSFMFGVTFTGKTSLTLIDGSFFRCSKHLDLFVERYAVLSRYFFSNAYLELLKEADEDGKTVLHLLSSSSTKTKDIINVVLSAYEEIGDMSTFLTLDKLKNLPLHYAIGTTDIVFESDHPYENDIDINKTFEVPGSKEFTVTFDQRTCTELHSDYVTFYKDEDKKDHFGESRYSGGTFGTEGNWPGVDGRPPLIISASRFVLSFHTDKEANAWGFKMLARCTQSTNIFTFEYFVSKLLKLSKESVQRSNNFFDYPLHILLEGSRFNKPLIELINSIDPEAVTRPGNNSKLPLIIALEKNAPYDVLQMLLPNKKINDGQSPQRYSAEMLPFNNGSHVTGREPPLHVACRMGAFEIAKALLEADPLMASVKAPDGKLPIHILLSKYEKKSVPRNKRIHHNPSKYLQEEAGDQVLQIELLNSLIEKFDLPDTSLPKRASDCLLEPDNAGRLPLHYAIANNNNSRKLIEEILRNVPEASNHKDAGGKSPLHYACESALSTGFVRALLTAAINAKIIEVIKRQSEQATVKSVNKNFQSIIKRLNEHGFPDIGSELSIKCIDQLKNVYQKSRHADSSSLIANGVVDQEINELKDDAKRIVDTWGDVIKERDSHGDLPIDIAIEKGCSLETIELLMPTEGADRESFEKYVLSLAVRSHVSAPVLNYLLNELLKATDRSKRDFIFSGSVTQIAATEAKVYTENQTAYDSVAMFGEDIGT